MKKILFSIFLFYFFCCSSAFSYSQEYISDSQKLENILLKTDKRTKNLGYKYLYECKKFGRKYFGKNFEEGCAIQLQKLSQKIFRLDTLEIEQREKEFYEKNLVSYFEMQFGGDIMLSRLVGKLNKDEGYDRIFKNFHPNKNISDDTLLFYNLESPFSQRDNDRKGGGFSFRANIKNIKVLTDLKQNNQMIVSLANNHITNAGGEGIMTTRKILSENNILFNGAGIEKPKILEMYNNGLKVCLSAYSYDGGKLYSRNYDNKLHKFFINKLSEKEILADIETMKEKKCQFQIISLHWGREYKFSPTKKQKKLAHTLIDNGVDLILGHHSHILGEVEEYKGKKIYYSLGNFIFDQDWGERLHSRGMDTMYDEQLQKNTVPTYIGNTFYHKYRVYKNFETELVEVKNTKHRIKSGALESYY